MVDPRSGCVNARDQVKDSTLFSKGAFVSQRHFQAVIVHCSFLYVLLCDAICDLADRHFLIKLVKF